MINDEVHHGSVIATLNRLHGLEPLTRRDATANDMLNVINLSEPRHPTESRLPQTFLEAYELLQAQGHMLFGVERFE